LTWRRGVIIETPELGHATYVFAKPKSMAVFLAIMRGPPRNTFSTTEAMWPNAWATWGASCTVPIRAAGSRR